MNNSLDEIYKHKKRLKKKNTVLEKFLLKGLADDGGLLCSKINKKNIRNRGIY